MSAFSVLASLPEDHFRCSICLDVFTDPVSTPCGHNFCRTCLNQHWDNNEFCHCPVCNKRFSSGLELSTNTFISEISVQIKRRKIETLESVDAPWLVKCDVCGEFKFKALKSCLVCLTSYCEAHLEPHQRVLSLMRHKLVDPVESLGERVCEKHARILDFFCRDEEVCICQLCCETQHRDHHTVPVEEEGAQQIENIESNRAKIKLMVDERIEKIKEITDLSEKTKVKTEKELEDSDKLFNAMMDKVKETHCKLKSNINNKLRKSQETDQEMIQQLHQEIADLQKKHSQLEELLQNEDPLKLLQTLQALNTISDTKDWSKTKVYPDLCMQTARRAMFRLVQSFQRELKTLANTGKLKRMRQYKESVTFDPSTAGPCLMVTESGTRLKHSQTARSLFEDSKRFELPMVFGTKGFTFGRHYWEVQVGLRNDWDVGVAMENVDKTEEAIVKEKNGFFSIGKTGFVYEANCTPSKVLHLCTRPRHVGVYLDYEEGRVSFYDVDEKQHIYTFSGEHFTGKLFPYFYLYSKAKKSEPLVIHTRESLFTVLPCLEPVNN